MSHFDSELSTGHQLGHDADDIKGEKYGGINIHTGSDAMVVDAEKHVSYGEDSIVQDEFDTEHTTTHRNLKVSLFGSIATVRFSTISPTFFRYRSL